LLIIIIGADSTQRNQKEKKERELRDEKMKKKSFK
jgi:hypothetical protein